MGKGRLEAFTDGVIASLRNIPWFSLGIGSSTRKGQNMTRSNWFNPRQVAKLPPLDPTTAPIKTGHLTEANRAIHAALAKAHHLAVNISVTVCNADGRLVAFQRMDGALAEADLASIGKALASVTSGRPSGDESVVSQRYFPRAATTIGEGTPLLRRPGGLPIIRAGNVEGALGVGGASDEQSVECALAGIDAIVGEGDNSGQYQPR